jgi:hypothetical protein
LSRKVDGKFIGKTGKTKLADHTMLPLHHPCILLAFGSEWVLQQARNAVMDELLWRQAPSDVQQRNCQKLERSCALSSTLNSPALGEVAA